MPMVPTSDITGLTGENAGWLSNLFSPENRTSAGGIQSMLPLMMAMGLGGQPFGQRGQMQNMLPLMAGLGAQQQAGSQMSPAMMRNITPMGLAMMGVPPTRLQQQGVR